jgi:hypothetical protein
MTAHVIRWQGPARRLAVRTALEPLLQDWQRNWAVAPGAVVVNDLSHASLQAAAYQLATSAAGASVVAGLDRAAIARLGGALAGAPTRVAADFNAALGVGEDALAALLSALLGAAATPVEQAEAPVEVMSDRYGWVCTEVRVGEIGFCLLLDPRLCDRLAPMPSKGEPLHRRTSALAQSTVAITASLELGTVDVSLVSSLRPGDILRTGIALTAPVTLGVAEGPAVFTGRLTALDQHKAIKAEKIH